MKLIFLNLVSENVKFVPLLNVNKGNNIVLNNLEEASTVREFPTLYKSRFHSLTCSYAGSKLIWNARLLSGMLPRYSYYLAIDIGIFLYWIFRSLLCEFNLFQVPNNVTQWFWYVCCWFFHHTWRQFIIIYCIVKIRERSSFSMNFPET